MDYKLDYITRMLTKIAHKRLESYVIHRIWNVLNKSDVHFVFQQYVVRKEGKYAHADLYLPQINLVVEIDEPTHYKNIEADKIRQNDIPEHTDVVRIKCYNVVDNVAVPCSLEELNQRTDNAIGFIQNRLSEMDATFIPWKDIDTIDSIRNRGYLKVEDNVSLYTSAHLHRHINSGEKRVTFLKYTDWLGITSYRFVGVFQLNKEKSENENKCIWERISDTYKFN